MIIDNYGEIRYFAFLPDRTLDDFRLLSGENSLTNYEIRQKIDEGYKKAAAEEGNPRIIYKNRNIIISDINSADRVCIITSILSCRDGSAIVLLFAPNRTKNKQPWEMECAISENEFNSDVYVEIGNIPRKMLYRYAFWPAYAEDLRILKNQLALPENWSFKENPSDDDFPILKSYIDYTFAKAWRDKQIVLSVDGRYSVFNTGLVNRNYQYIYILFERNAGQSPWKFSMFCIPGIRQGGRLLADNFKVLPTPVRYFSDISDISYMISNDKTPDEQLPDLQPDHYFIDHPERLPLHFLLDGCRKNQNIIYLLKLVFEALEAAFRNAVRKAVMRVSWNYRTAIPVYFPSYNKMSILLPLSFSSKTEAEIALVVEYNSVSQKYTAPTILTLPVAYSNARLVGKPESDWLNQRVFEPEACNVKEEDENDLSD